MKTAKCIELCVDPSGLLRRDEAAKKSITVGDLKALISGLESEVPVVIIPPYNKNRNGYADYWSVRSSSLTLIAGAI